MKRQSGANANINMLNAKEKVKVTTILFLLASSAALLRLRIRKTLPHVTTRFEIKEALKNSFLIWKKVQKGMHYILYANITMNFVNGLTLAFLILYATQYVSTVI